MKLFLFTLLFTLNCFAATVAFSGSPSNLIVMARPNTVTWASLASGDSGAGIEVGYAKSLSMQLSGTFTATTVLIEGSNDGTTYYTMDDIEGTAISKTAAAFSEIRDRPKYIRPRISAGGASSDVTGVMYMTK